MQIVLSKTSDVPLRHQLAEQLVFLIATGRLRAGDELPSVRALARQSNVHHNTVSEAYQDLVRRGWLTRRRGSRLIVGVRSGSPAEEPQSLDELINDSIRRARNMGYSLQSLRERVRQRLLAQPPDHVLIVEEELGLREILKREIRERLDWPVEGCSFQEFAKEPGISVGTQVVAPNHLLNDLNGFVPASRPAIGIAYSHASEQLDLIRKLKDPSMIAVVSVSESFLRTARGLLAQALGRRHVLNEVFCVQRKPIVVDGIDLAFCDSVTFSLVRASRKVPYRLISSDCLAHLAASLQGPTKNV